MKKRALQPSRLSLAVALAFTAGAHAQSLPTGAQVTAGAATVHQTGATSLVVTQATDRAALNWQSFSIGAGHSVRFDQPSASSIALNRVTGGSRSEIYGNLSANGQVFLVNPNGVLFGRSAQVDVGGLVASTLDISDRDFLDGKYVFSDPANRASVINKGTLSGRYVALIGHRTINSGTVHANSVALGGGSTVRLALADNKLVSFEVQQSALDALAENGGLIRADGGRVILTAGARDSLLASAVNNTGVIEARTVQSEAGNILLLAGMEAGTTTVGGTLDASAPNGGDGGFIETSGSKIRIQNGAQVATKAADGKTGRWLIDPQDFTIAASGGDMTGSALSNALSLSSVEIQSASGATAGNGDIHINDVVSWSANELKLTAERDININAVMTASGSSSLVMDLGGKVQVGLGHTAFAGRVDFDRSGAGFLTINGEGYTVIRDVNELQAMAASGRYALGANVDASDTVSWNGGLGFAPIAGFTGVFDGLGHTVSSLRINRPSESDVGLFGSASGATVRNAGLSGGTIQGASRAGAIAGSVDGSTLHNLFATSNVSGSSNVGGLIGSADGATVSRVHATGSVNGSGSGVNTGGLIGSAGGTTVSDSYATGAVTGDQVTGGLIGRLEDFNSTATRVYASGDVTGRTMIGGLVGLNRGVIQDAYATGTVTGTDGTTPKVGGVAGSNDENGFLERVYAANGVVNSHTGADGSTGGIIGDNSEHGTLLHGYWDASLRQDQEYDVGPGIFAGSQAGRLGGGAAKQQASYVGFDFTNTWIIYEGLTHPLLRTFMTPLTVTASNAAKTYDGNGFSGGNGVSYSATPNAADLLGTLGYGGSSQGARNAGTYAIRPQGLYSHQHGYAITFVDGTLTVAQAALSLSTSNVTKTYDGNTSASGTLVAVGGTQLFGTDTFGGATFTFDNKNAGSNKTVSVSGATVNDGNGGGNYSITYVDNTTSTITPKALTVSGITAADKVYDGTTSATVDTAGASYAGLLAGDAVVVSATGAFDNKNVGNGKTVALTSSYTGADVGNYSITDQATTTASITPASLTLSTSDVTRTYDGTTSAAGTAIVAGGTLFAGDSLSGGTFAFLDKNAGTGKTVTVSGVAVNDGNGGGNYNVTYADNTTSTITPKALAVSGITAADKVYDGTTSATVDVTGASFTGLVSGDAVTVDATGSFADKHVGNGKTVTLSSTYGGADAGNYSITDQASATASITPKALAVSGITAADKVYDGTTLATVDVSSASFTGLVSGDAVTVNATGTFGDKHVGNGKTVSLASAYGGADAGNYTITDQATTTASITPASLTLGTSDVTKTYDGTTTAAGTAIVAGGTLFAGDSLSGGTFAFLDKNAGTGKTVTVSGVAVNDGNGGNNYDVTYVNNTTSTITPKALAVSGIAAADKVYDGTTSAAVDVSGAIYSGLISGDDVTVGATGTFGDKNVGNGKVVTLSSTYGGADVGNYSITSQADTTADITPKALTVSGITAADKVYDGTTSATVNVAGALYTGLVAGDAVVVSATGAFGDKNVGGGKVVTLSSSYSGADVGNYSITSQADTTADITPKALTVSGITAADKVYDGTTLATVDVSGASLTGLVSGDAVTVNATGAFGDKNVGNGKVVTLSSTYSGADVGNYSIASQADTTADITPKALAVSGIAAADKVYDGTISATVDVSAAIFTGLVSGDAVTVIATGSFGDKNVGNGKVVTLSSSYSGADVGNYSITSQADTTADITPKALTVSGITAADKVYDGTTSATVNVAGAVYAGLVAGDAVVVSATGGFDDKNVGNGKVVTLSSTYSGADVGNYSITSQADTTADITPAALTIRANDITKTEGTAYSFAGTEFSATGLAAGETIGSVLLSSAGAPAAAATGPYAISASGASGGSFSISNYDVTYVDGVMTVVAAPPAPPPPNVSAGGDERRSAAIMTAEQAAPGTTVPHEASHGIRFTLIDAGINLPQGVE